MGLKEDILTSPQRIKKSQLRCSTLHESQTVWRQAKHAMFFVLYSKWMVPKCVSDSLFSHFDSHLSNVGKGPWWTKGCLAVVCAKRLTKNEKTDAGLILCGIYHLQNTDLWKVTVTQRKSTCVRQASSATTINLMGIHMALQNQWKMIADSSQRLLAGRRRV